MGSDDVLLKEIDTCVAVWTRQCGKALLNGSLDDYYMQKNQVPWLSSLCTCGVCVVYVWCMCGVHVGWVCGACAGCICGACVVTCVVGGWCVCVWWHVTCGTCGDMMWCDVV
jgi:hypothetical protein